MLIGKPFEAATVIGADIVLTYDPANGYATTVRLSLGQGAWAYSAAGAMVTVAPSP